MFILSYLIYIYPFDILLFLLQKQSPTIFSTIFQTLVIELLVVYYLRSSTTFLPLKIFVYEGLGIGFISFWIVNIMMLCQVLTKIEPERLGLVTICLILAVVTFSYLSSQFFKIKTINILSNKIKTDFNIIFFSDVHLGSNRNGHLRKLTYRIQKLKSDIILIGGDLIDSSSFQVENLKILTELNIPIYFITGNHEHYLKDFDNKMSKIKKTGFYLLNNSNVTIDSINLIGLSDSTSKTEKIKIVKQITNKELYNICLVHQPSIWDNVDKSVDLMLSGHTHRGQIFPFNFLVKLKFQYIYGLYRRKNCKLYVTSGAGTWGPRMRLGSLNEIVELRLRNSSL